MNSNSRNERQPQPESGTDDKINKSAPIPTISAPSYHGSTDTEHRVPKQNPPKTENTDRNPFLEGLSVENKTNPLFDFKPTKTLSSLSKYMQAHNIEGKESPSLIDSWNKLDRVNLKPEALPCQPKFASDSTFVFSAGMHGLPKVNVTGFSFPSLLSTSF